MNRIINSIILVISILFFGLVIITGILPNFMLDTMIMLGCLFIPIAISIIVMIIEIKTSKNEEEKEKIIKFWMKILFSMYCLTLFTILFLSSEYRLIYTSYNDNPFTQEHFASVNIIPFKTLIEFSNNWSIKVLIMNVVVNLLLFMPMGLFIPTLFKNKVNNLKQFVLIMIIISVGVEIMQFITFRGATDVDDVILNVLGSIIAYLFVKSKIGTKLLNKILK